jgi:hypothetical protein
VTPGFIALYLGAFVRPRRALEALLTAPKRGQYAALAVALTGIAYGLVYFFLARNGGRPTVFHPWLAIPAESYYRFNQYVIVPSILLAWVSAAGFTHLTARALGGTGSYEDTLIVLGFGLSLASWWTGVHDVVTTGLGFFGVLDQRAYEDAMSSPTPFRTMLWILMAGYATWFLLMFTRGVGAAHRLPVGRSATAGLVGFVVYQLLFVVFNR